MTSENDDTPDHQDIAARLSECTRRLNHTMREAVAKGLHVVIKVGKRDPLPGQPANADAAPELAVRLFDEIKSATTT